VLSRLKENVERAAPALLQDSFCRSFAALTRAARGVTMQCVSSSRWNASRAARTRIPRRAFFPVCRRCFTGSRTLGDCGTRLVIPSVDLTRGQTVVFKTPHLPTLFRDRRVRVIDALLSTTAAPTYFPHAVVKAGSAYIDGGVWANNPSMVAYVETLKICESCSRDALDEPFEHCDISLLSIGTGRPTYALDPPEAGAGLAWWAPHLFDISSLSQSQGVDFQMRYVLGNRYRRIDYDIPEKGWTLDRADLVDRLTHLGRNRATDTFLELRPLFFTGPAPRFHPFSEAQPAA
jgi:hypothetical protein